MIKTSNINLKPYNTFGLSAKISTFILFNNAEELRVVFSEMKNDEKWFILGGGSNILITKDFKGTFLKSTADNISEIKQDERYVWIKADAGVDWDYFVEKTINMNLYGLENLSYIPGSVGASPVQNIGAYGAEAKDTIYSVEYFDTKTQSVETIYANKCDFGYRDSIFKRDLKGRAIVLSVTYKLSKIFTPNLTYSHLAEYFNQQSEITAKSVRDFVINIRRLKLPDPKEIGNGGSFFKNPVITKEHFKELSLEHPDIPSYITDKGVKVPAGWLIEKSGWKGKRINDAGVHTKQALVLVNYGEASGLDILDLSHKIIIDIKNLFNIEIEPEINIL